MHMADALVAPLVAGAMYACSGSAFGYSVKKVRLLNEPEKIPVMGVMGAFVFAAQMINFTIPGTASSGHLCGGMLLSAILGPFAGFLTMAGILLVQCLLFADGGILALGCNIWNMAFYGCFVGAMIIWRNWMKGGLSKRKITAASIFGCVVSLQLGAFSVSLQTLASGITELPFGAFLAAMQPIHLAIGLVEGLITAAVLCFIYDARPELLWGYDSRQNPEIHKEGKISYRHTVFILAATAVVTGGLVSLAASGHPDGLEWSIRKITGETELEPESEGSIHKGAETIQETTAVLPDYAFKNTDSAIGTSLSGIVGGIVVIGVCLLFCLVFRLYRRKRKDE